MPKIRVHELAKQLGVTSKELMTKLEGYGTATSNHFSSLEDTDVARLTNDFSKGKGAVEKPKPKQEPEAAAPAAKQEPQPEVRIAPAKSEPEAQAPSKEEKQQTEEKQQIPRSLGEDGRPQPSQGEDGRPVPPLGSDGKPLQRRPRPLGEDGRPLPPLGPDGKPLQRRPRPLGEDGRPLPPLGPDGKPLQRRPRPLGEDGRPLPPLGPDGKPLQRRPRPLGEDGRPLPPLGPDGKPLQRRPRPLGEDGRPLPPLGPDGKPLQRRPRPLGEDGRPLPPLGPDGKPLQRRPRPLGPDGRPLPPLGADGKPLQRRPQPAVGTEADLPATAPVASGSALSSVDKPERPADSPPSDATGQVPAKPAEIEKPIDKSTDTPAATVAESAGTPPLTVVRPRPDAGQAGQRPPRDGRPESRPRPAGDSRPRPDGTRPQYGDRPRPDGTRPQYSDRPRSDGTRPQYSDRPRPDGTRPQYSDRPRPDGTRPQYGDRPRPDGTRPQYGDRPRPDGTRPQYGDRPRPDGTRPQYGDRPRPDGTRPQYGDRPRPDGTRPQYGDRPRSDGTRPQYGDRPRPDGTRPSFGSPRPGGGPGGRGPAPGGRGPGFAGPPRPGAPRGGPGAARGPAGAGRPEAKKGEPTKDDRKSQWGRSAQARSTQRDKNERSKEGGQNQSRGGRNQNRGPRPVQVKKVMPKIPDVTEIKVAAEITVRDLAEKLHRSNADVIKVLMKKGLMVTANQVIDFETASHVAESFNVLVEEYIEVDAFEAAFEADEDEEENLQPRPPVVVVMGHVDHGKTSLLDVIRSENVQAQEAGGITQHIGAYSTSINGKAITFLDTPGHEAFTAMRMRGAQVTDIAILVVAADDGVMPQTIEAINHAKAAGVEIIVAINKMDKPGANPDRVKQELTEHGLQSEDWGGETITVPVSALQRTGIDQLLEMILLVAEMKELRANPDKSARGSIIEAKLDKGRGPVATVLVQSGTLKIGDPVVAGACFGKVRAMTDSRGRSLKEAGPSTPVEIIGLAEVPVTGDILYTAQSDKQARQLSETVVAKGRVNMIKSTQGKVSLDDLFSQIQAGQVKDLNIVVKADVQGSVEALRGSLEKLSNEEVRVRIIHTGVGAINESDVMLASASNAIIIGFNVRPDVSAKSTAEAEQVDIRTYSVIYSAIDDIEAAMKGMLDPEFEEKVLGHAEIRQVFKASSVGNIAGCYVNDGRITRNAQVRLIRDGRVIYDGHLDALRRFKDDAREVAAGYECGMLFKNYSDIKEGDRIEAYIMEEIPR